MRRSVGAAAVVIAAAAAPVTAQELSLSAAQGLSSDRLLGDPRGPAAAVTWRLEDRLGVRAGIHVLSKRQTRIGRACTGLVEPGTCPDEEVDDRTSLTGVVVGLVASVVRRNVASLSLVPAVAIVGARTRTRGRQTGNSLDASGPMLGIGAGAELSLVPRGRWPVAVHLGAHVGRLSSPEKPIVDGYSPFSQSFDLTRVELGVSVWKPRSTSSVTGRR